MKKHIFLCILFLFVTACNNSDGGYTTSAPTETKNAAVHTYAALEKSFSNFQTLRFASLSTPARGGGRALAPNPFAETWTATNFLLDPAGNDSQHFIGFAQWTQSLLRPNSFSATARPVGPTTQLSESLKRFCAAGVLVGENTDENEYPVLGDYTGENAIELTTSKAAQLELTCGVRVRPSEIGQKYSVQVLDPNPQLDGEAPITYARQIRIEFPATSFTGKAETYNFFFKQTLEITNFAYATNGPDGILRELASVDETNGFTRYEFLSGPVIPSTNIGGVVVSLIGPPGTYSGYRMLYNTKTDNAYIAGDYQHVVSKLAPVQRDSMQRFSVSAKAHAEDKDLSVSTVFATNANNSDPYMREACVRGNNASLVLDGERCAATPLSLPGYSADELNALTEAIKGFNGKCEKINLNDSLKFTEEDFHRATFSCI